MTNARSTFASDFDGVFAFERVMLGRYTFDAFNDEESHRLGEFEVEGDVDAGIIALDDVGYADFVLEGCTSERPVVDVYAPTMARFLPNPVLPGGEPAKLPPCRYFAGIVDGSQRPMLKEFEVRRGLVTLVTLSRGVMIRLDVSLAGLATCSKYYLYVIESAAGAPISQGSLAVANCEGSIEANLPGGEAAYHLRVWNNQGVNYTADFTTRASGEPLSVVATLVHR